jgi:hypothetical protein
VNSSLVYWRKAVIPEKSGFEFETIFPNGEYFYLWQRYRFVVKRIKKTLENLIINLIILE